MQHVTATDVSANVRPYGAIGKFFSRNFTLMLGPGELHQKHKEAIRILNQIGWETNGVNIHDRTEGNQDGVKTNSIV